MILKSFGCSFISGEDLSDRLAGQPYSTLTWPAHLAQHLDYSYECYACPGIGNLQIAEQVLNQIDNRPALFIINWTWIDRFDYNYKVDDTWRTIMPGDTDNCANFYYRELHSEYRDKLSTLIYMRTIIDILKEKNINFIMTCMDNLAFDQRCHTTTAVLDLQNYIQPHIVQFDDRTFLEWSRDHGFPESKWWHPLDEAHKAAGDYIIKVFDKKNINDR